MNDIEIESALHGAGKQTSNEEMAGLGELIRANGCTNVAEIGISEGRSLLFWACLMDESGLLIGIDAHNILKWDTSIAKPRVELIFGDSKNDSTEAMFAVTLGDRKLDFLRIDGGHDYESVSNDHRRYEKYVRPGGLIAFHDNYSSKEVARFTNELKNKHDIKYILWDNKPETAYYFK
jgi:predicted O-methyltransferase YrrM